LGTFEKLEENFCYHIVGSAAFTAWKFIMLGVPEGKESAFGGGNILSFCAFMVPHMSGIVFHHFLQAVFFYRFCFVPHCMHPAWLIGSDSSSDQSCSFLPISFLPILRCRRTVAETDEISFLL